MKNCLFYDAIRDFLVKLRTGSNPVNINRFQSHTANNIFVFFNPNNCKTLNLLAKTNKHRIFYCIGWRLSLRDNFFLQINENHRKIRNLRRDNKNLIYQPLGL